LRRNSLYGVERIAALLSDRIITPLNKVKDTKMNFWVYILKCADDSYYTGHTDNLEQRIAQHQQRYFPGCYTATRLPVALVYSQPFPTRLEALSAEQQIKGWSRKKKEAMMRGDWLGVSRLAKSKNMNTVQPDHELVESVEEQLHPNTVRPELVESVEVQLHPNTVRPELVEGHSFTNSPSTSSGRTINTITVPNKENQT
jgi:putative endonuclease